MSTVIKVENVSKQYRLGQIGTGTLSHDLNRWWHKVRGKEDPFLKIGEANDRTQKGSSDYVWALQNINFEVKQGEVLGIIGRNGAGKSTLLKILSKTTAPTTGSIKIKGRIASLLEVGTGFHPELSGRDNIFLNGAILGMSKHEIKSKFDEIVDFSGVERYIDTPVKRYSSGMYVRLAFAVAAHLEPEILIIDEVLAVGDLEFQKKCLGKMNDVSKKDGRTILFVSHNMDAIANLCKSAILLQHGLIKSTGLIDDIVGQYIALNKKSLNRGIRVVTNEKHRGGIARSEEVRIEEVFFENNEVAFSSDEPLVIHLEIKSKEDIDGFRVAGSIWDVRDKAVGTFFGDENLSIKQGETKIVTCTLPSHHLAKGDYFLSFSVGKGNPATGLKDFDVVREVISFEINKFNGKHFADWRDNWGNIFFPVNTTIQ